MGRITRRSTSAMSPDQWAAELAAMSPGQITEMFAAMHPGERAAALAAMSLEQRPAALAAMTPEQRAAALAAMSAEQRAETMAAMSNEHNLATLGAMTSQQRALALAGISLGRMAALLGAMTLGKRAAALRAMSAEQRATTLAAMSAEQRSEALAAMTHGQRAATLVAMNADQRAAELAIRSVKTSSIVKLETVREAVYKHEPRTPTLGPAHQMLFRRHNTEDGNRGRHTIHELLRGNAQLPICKVAASQKRFEGDLGAVDVIVCVTKALHPYAPGVTLGVVGERGDKTGVVFLSAMQLGAQPFPLFTRPDCSAKNAFWQYCGHYRLQRVFHAGECGIPALPKDDDVVERRITFAEIFDGEHADCGEAWVQALITHPNWSCSLKRLVVDAVAWGKDGTVEMSEPGGRLRCERVEAFKVLIASPYFADYNKKVADAIYEAIPADQKKSLVKRFLTTGGLETGYAVIEYYGYDNKLYDALCQNQKGATWATIGASPKRSTFTKKKSPAQGGKVVYVNAEKANSAFDIYLKHSLVCCGYLCLTRGAHSWGWGWTKQHIDHMSQCTVEEAKQHIEHLFSTIVQSKEFRERNSDAEKAAASAQRVALTFLSLKPGDVILMQRAKPQHQMSIGLVQEHAFGWRSVDSLGIKNVVDGYDRAEQIPVMRVDWRIRNLIRPLLKPQLSIPVTCQQLQRQDIMQLVSTRLAELDTFLEQGFLEQGNPFVGRDVLKYFNGEPYRGRVWLWMPHNPRVKGPLWKVVYADGDVEDLELQEIEVVLIKLEAGKSPKLVQEHQAVAAPNALLPRQVAVDGSKHSKRRRRKREAPVAMFDTGDMVWANCGAEGWWPAIIDVKLSSGYYSITFIQEGKDEVQNMHCDKFRMFDPNLRVAEDNRVEWLSAVDFATRLWHRDRGTESEQMRRGRDLENAHNRFATLDDTSLECAVCLRDWSDTTETENKSGQLAMAVCGHIFCAGCVDGWAEDAYNQRQCPSCRARVDAWIPFSISMEEIENRNKMKRPKQEQS